MSEFTIEYKTNWGNVVILIAAFILIGWMFYVIVRYE